MRLFELFSWFGALRRRDELKEHEKAEFRGLARPIRRLLMLLYAVCFLIRTFLTAKLVPTAEY